jgi:LmbE family N-acetylglucosaminyl deacetylase
MKEPAPAYRPFRVFPQLIDPGSVPVGTAVVVAPHPDDEIIGCGGAMAMHRARGDRVVILHVTGGEEGDPGSLEQDDLVAVRLREAREAAAELDVHEIVTLGQPDGSVQPTAALISRLEEDLVKLAPAVVYAPSPLECHPDHLATCWLAAHALAATPFSARLCMYEINHPTLASWLLDVTPYMDRKREALARFVSQQRYQDIIGKCMAGAYARTVNIAIPGIDYAEAFLEIDPARLPEVWEDLRTLCERIGIAGGGT